MSYVDAILYGAGGNGGGGISPADAVLVTPQSLSAAQQTQARENIGAASDVHIVIASGSEAVIVPEVNTVYRCGTLTSLTITNPPAAGSWSVVFTSGAVATSTTLPANIFGLEEFAALKNTLYEVNVLDNRAVIGSWAVQVDE